MSMDSLARFQRRGSVGIEERSQDRRKRIVTHRAAGFEEAERWDLEYWQSKTPAERLAALHAIHRDIAKIRAEAG